MVVTTKQVLFPEARLTSEEIGLNCPDMPTTSPSIHGHEVIHLVHDAESTTPFTPETLAAELRRRYGADPRFHACHPGAMTINELLDFLLSRGKIVLRAGRLYTDFSKVCGNGEHHDHDHEH